MNSKEAQLDKIFQALANKHRRAIIYRLSLQPASIMQLAKEQKLSLPAIHKHIKILEQARLLKRKKSGRVNFLALDRAALVSLQSWIAQYHSYWGSQEESLENYVSAIEQGASETINK
jgi:DNA-binding transcriptional ArsR family regulator